MAENGRFNVRNPAVKRIVQESREMQKENSREMQAQALEDNIFEWHFAVRGPPDSEFEGGVYHGRIIMPSDYPFRPPAFMLLTPNGRFETGVKICLSISAHHPEHWQPSWSVRTALTALVAFMPSPGNGAIGSLDFPKEERRRLAALSRREFPKFGSLERQQVTQEVHQRMLEVETQASSPKSEVEDPQTKPLPPPTGPSTSPASASEPHLAHQAPSLPPLAVSPPCRPLSQPQSQPVRHAAPAEVREGSWEDRGLGLLAAAISLAIMAILGRKMLGVDIADFF